MVELDDHQAVNVLGLVYFFRVGEACFFQDPVVILILGAFFHSQHVSGTKHWYTEILFDIADRRIGGERAVRNVNHVALSHLCLHPGIEDIVEFIQDDGFVHHASKDTS